MLFDTMEMNTGKIDIRKTAAKEKSLSFRPTADASEWRKL